MAVVFCIQFVDRTDPALKGYRVVRISSSRLIYAKNDFPEQFLTLQRLFTITVRSKTQFYSFSCQMCNVSFYNMANYVSCNNYSLTEYLICYVRFQSVSQNFFFFCYSVLLEFSNFLSAIWQSYTSICVPSCRRKLLGRQTGNANAVSAEVVPPALFKLPSAIK